MGAGALVGEPPVNETIHIVDDDPAVRDSVRVLLEAHDFVVRAYASGMEFMANGNVDRGGCLLLDVNMPGMSGIDVLQAVRARGSDLPVVLITGLRENLDRIAAARVGALGLLEKPFTEGALLASIRAALEPGRP